MKQYLNKLCEEEAEKIAKKRQEQAVLRDQLNVCNAEILRRREMAKEQEKIIDERVLQFQEEKAVSRPPLSALSHRFINYFCDWFRLLWDRLIAQTAVDISRVLSGLEDGMNITRFNYLFTY